ncbi:hypothetical protein HDU76_012334 [Blyttiomyces sp. JEL0837]|nr:hypothetical protein HDU76_012334 [Blyttiomyces sp. JEL0837]
MGLDVAIKVWKDRIRTLHIEETDVIHSTWANLMRTTLYPDSQAFTPTTLHKGQKLPRSWHLALFPKAIPEKNLANDGYDLDFVPPSPYERRLWAAGNIEWIRTNPLLIGDSIRQITTVERVDFKPASGSTGASVLVWMKKAVENDRGPSIVEDRCLAYVSTPSSPSDFDRQQKKNATLRK